LESYVLCTKSTGCVSHTSENLSLIIKAVADKWGMRDKLRSIVTNNAANITNAISIVGCINIRCAAHTLRLSIKDCFIEDSIDKILAKCRAIVASFKRSNK
jgi:hypothetical protein